MGEKFTLAIASTLRLDGAPDSDYYEPDEKVSRQSRRAGKEGNHGAHRTQQASFTAPPPVPPSPLLPMQPSLLDKYDLGMCGKVFKYEYMDDNRV